MMQNTKLIMYSAYLQTFRSKIPSSNDSFSPVFHSLKMNEIPKSEQKWHISLKEMCSLSLPMRRFVNFKEKVSWQKFNFFSHNWERIPSFIFYPPFLQKFFTDYRFFPNWLSISNNLTVKTMEVPTLLKPHIVAYNKDVERTHP